DGDRRGGRGGAEDRAAFRAAGWASSDIMTPRSRAAGSRGRGCPGRPLRRRAVPYAKIAAASDR
ncbi:hypothetical protein AB0B79_41330, partial [Streptomyces sp. NPDC039022]|uniref:hypothetical protein n=1 Tax=Streptomyces sp. NPDC039022 TaxID=3157091 RepID=UPI0033D355DD